MGNRLSRFRLHCRGGGDIAVARIWEGYFFALLNVFTFSEPCFSLFFFFLPKSLLRRLRKEGKEYLMTDCLGDLIAVSAGGRANKGGNL